MSIQVHPDIIAAKREVVLSSYDLAVKDNYLLYLQNDVKATDQYIYENQKFDGMNISNIFYEKNRRVISVQKKTKVGADGLMIEIAKILTTHNDDSFIVDLDNVRILTGMSNAGWEKDMIDKAPACFKDKIFHHGKLSRADLINIRNGLIIIDEIDSGDKEYQVLHNTLKEAGILDVQNMEEHNNRFVFISATMIKELYDLYRWGELHELYKMTIPFEYIGHKDFLEREIIREFYSLATDENANKWVIEDILNYYGNDFRVHLVRSDKKTIEKVQNACIINRIAFRNHTSKDRLTEDEIREFFENNLNQHIVLAVKGFFRRANLIPNRWKLRIGATHELFTKKVDNNVQVQGLPGRMTGYWRNYIEQGYKIGPYRTSIKAIEEYENSYNNPFDTFTYQSSGFKKSKKGKILIRSSTMLSPKHIMNLTPINLPIIFNKASNPIIIISNATQSELEKFDDHLEMLNIIKKYNEDIYEEYKEYEIHCWRIDTPAKWEKFCLNTMTKFGAISSETNIKNKKKNVLMIYLNENSLIINAWSGQRNVE